MGIPVSDHQITAVRALLAGDIAEHDRIVDGSADKKIGAGYWALIDATFVIAVDRYFADEYTDEEVKNLVADARARHEDVAESLDPEKSERVILAKLGEGNVDDLEPEELMRIESVLLAMIVTADGAFSASELDDLLAEARALAEGRAG